jgi:1,4-dihydroxy-2-naphthoate octaprenyltransferase
LLYRNVLTLHSTFLNLCFSTYYDFVTGNDRRETSGDRTLFDYNLKLWHVGVLTLISYSLALLIGTYALAIGGLDLLWLFVVGLALTYSYTATPFKLKARALGDLVILLCFGPLPMLGIYFMHTRVWSFAVFLHSLPVGMLAVAILHTNNARDVTSDRKANATTLAQLLGREGSYYFYMALLGVSYAMVLLLEFTGVSSSHRATSGASRSSSSLLAFLPFAALPIARKLLGKFKAGQFETLTEETAQFAFLFGVLWIAVFVVRLVL